MESNRFDELSRSIAARSSRRSALGRLGGGGLAALLLGRAGVRSASAAGSCTLQLSATVAVGTEKKTAYAGELTLTVGMQGAIDDGSLTTPDGKTHPVVGQTTGRLLGLRVSLPAGQFLTLTGVGEQDVVLCRGRIDGTFGGPKSSDMGTWSTLVGAKTSASGNGSSAAGAGGGATGGNGSASGGANATGNSAAPTATPTTSPPTSTTTTTTTSTTTTTPTTTTAPAPGPCAKTNESCASAPCCIGFCDQNNLCECVPDGSECQHTGTGACCSGAPCNADGFCGACVLLNAPCATDADCCTGQTITACCFSGISLSNVCTDVGAAGACPGQAPAGNCPSGQTACGASCADLSSNAGNCGSCGTSCGLGAVCSGGACVSSAPSCLSDQTACTPGGGIPCCDFLTCENQGGGFICQCNPTNDVCADSRECCSGNCQSDGFCA